jgi:hypothetical protein
MLPKIVDGASVRQSNDFQEDALIMEESLRQAFADDGAVFIRDCLNQEQLGQCREAFDWAVANPGPGAFQIFERAEHQTHNDNANPNAKEKLDALVATLPLGRMLAELWGSGHVWYFAGEAGWEAVADLALDWALAPTAGELG